MRPHPSSKRRAFPRERVRGWCGAPKSVDEFPRGSVPAPLRGDSPITLGGATYAWLIRSTLQPSFFISGCRHLGCRAPQSHILTRASYGIQANWSPDQENLEDNVPWAYLSTSSCLSRQFRKPGIPSWSSPQSKLLVMDMHIDTFLKAFSAYSRYVQQEVDAYMANAWRALNFFQNAAQNDKH